MRITRVYLLGLLLVCVGGYGAIQYVNARAENEARLQRVAAAQVVATNAAAKAASQRLYEDIALKQAVPSAYPRPESDWQNNEKAFYQKVLSEGKFDTLVVPFQVMGWSFDRSTRSLMTAELTLAIAQTSKATLPDPYVVAKALGDGQRQFKQDDVVRLADTIGVKRIVWGYAGHDRKGKMRIVLEIQDKSSPVGSVGAWTGAKTTKDFENIAFTDEVPPIEAYEALLPDMLKVLGLEASAPIFNQVVSKLDLTELPASPNGLGGTTDNPARDAYSFLLYHALTPATVERAQERFAEKALLAQLRLSPASPEYKALRARTLMVLGHRLAAIRVIGSPQTDEEREVLAALNGNFPEVRAIASRERNPLKRLIQKLEEDEIGSAYGVINAKESSANAQALKLPGNIWPFIATRAIMSRDNWSQFENAQLKMLLDYELPVKGYSLNEIAQGAMTIGDPNKLQLMIDLSVFHHGRKYVEQNASTWCCKLAFDRPGGSDYLELLQSYGQDNLIRQLYFYDELQGRPDRAMAIANSIEVVYKGHPYYSVRRSAIELNLAQKAGGAEKEALLKAAYMNAFNAMYWEQSQSFVSSAASSLVSATQRQDYARYGNFYYTDLPYRSDYWTWADGGNMQTQIDNQIAALKNSTYHFRALKNIVAYYNQFFPHESKASDLLKSIAGRFSGSPDRNRLFASEALKNGDAKLAESLYRENLKLTPSLWSVYQDLGRFLLTNGQVAESTKVFLAYPGFKKGTNESRVGVANNAYEAGSQFYWAGFPELAKPFYAISASQRTGAGSEIASSLRLKLMAGDIQGAMADTLEGAQRYQDNYRYQDYLGMLHASGLSKDAWAGFGVLVQAGQGAEILESALVGHHLSGLTATEVVTWVNQSGLKESGRQEAAAASYLLLFATTDRTPSIEEIEAIQSWDIARFQLNGTSRLVYRHTPKVPSGPNEQRVRSTLALFAEGYRSLKVKDFVAAKSAFDEAAKIDDLTEVNRVAPRLFYLPYYALASVKTADTKGIEKLLSSVNSQERGFYYYLARAVLDGGAGDGEKAFESLNLARIFSPGLESWPLLKPHTYGEISEWVGDMTGSSKIRALTIDWAKKFQMMQPWLSWSYALEAKLTQNPVDRKRAIAMTHYLDPKSERLSSFKKSEIDEAVRMFGKSNPFTKKPTQGAIKGDV